MISHSFKSLTSKQITIKCDIVKIEKSFRVSHKLKLQYFAAAEFAADFQLRTHTFETADARPRPPKRFFQLLLRFCMTAN